MLAVLHDHHSIMDGGHTIVVHLVNHLVKRACVRDVILVVVPLHVLKV